MKVTTLKISFHYNNEIKWSKTVDMKDFDDLSYHKMMIEFIEYLKSINIDFSTIKSNIMTLVSTDGLFDISNGCLTYNQILEATKLY